VLFRIFCESLTTTYKDSLDKVVSFTEGLRSDFKSIYRKRSFGGWDALSADQRARVHQLYLYNGLFVNYERMVQVAEELMNNNVEFIVTELIGVLSDFGKRCSANLSLRVYLLLIKRLSSGTPAVLGAIAKALDHAINSKADLSLRLTREIHKFMSNTSALKPETKYKCLEILVNVKFDSLEDKEVVYYLLEVFLEQIRKYIGVVDMEKDRVREMVQAKKRQREKESRKTRRVSAKGVVTEAIEREVHLMKQVLRGLNRILPLIKNSKFLTDFLDANLKSFFRFARTSHSSLSVQILVFLFSVLKSDFYSKLMERFLTLVFDFIKTPAVFEGRLSEQVFDLLFSVLKNDFSVERVKAMLLRLLSSVMHSDSKVVMSSLLLFHRISMERLAVREMIRVAKSVSPSQPHYNDNDDDNDEDSFKDVDEDKDNDKDSEAIDIGEKSEGVSQGVSVNKKNKKRTANGEKRNPMYVSSDQRPLYQFLFFKSHFNPTVRKVANLIIDDRFEEVDYKGNPFNDFANLTVLNKYAFRIRSPHVRTSSVGGVLRKRPVLITLDNYQQLDGDDSALFNLYFENKMRSAKLKQGRERERRNGEQSDIEEEVDEFADDLIETEMIRMNNQRHSREEDLSDDNFEGAYGFDTLDEPVKPIPKKTKK